MAPQQRKKKSGDGILAKIASFFLAAGLVYAFFSIPGHQSTEGVFSFFAAKSKTIEVWYEGLSSNDFTFSDLFNGTAANSPEGGGSTATPAATTQPDINLSAAEKTLKNLPTSNKKKTSYDRDDWNHWTTSAGANGQSCWTVREEVLYRQAEKGTQILKDKSGNKTIKYKKACEITGGTWKDPYSGKTFKNPKDLDIDHVIALKYADQTGGNKWSAAKKEQYANDLNGTHLLAVAASDNRAKSDKGPSEWKPANKGYHCDYAKTWVQVASNYKLTIPKKDVKELTTMLKTCQ